MVTIHYDEKPEVPNPKGMIGIKIDHRMPNAEIERHLQKIGAIEAWVFVSDHRVRTLAYIKPSHLTVTK